MHIHTLVIALTAAGVLNAGQTLWAQSSGSGGSGSGRVGMFGNQNLGGSFSPGQRTAFGGGGSTDSGDSGGSGGSGQGMGQGNGGLLNGSERFVRGNRRSDDFVGANTKNRKDFVGASQAGRNSGSNSFGDSNGPGSMLPGGAQQMQHQGQGRQGAQGMQQSMPSAIRVRSMLRLGFERVSPDMPRVTAVLSRRLADSPAIHARGPLQVELQGRTAVLRGVVATDHDRALAEQMARLEPGIEKVRNEIVIGTGSTATGPVLEQPALGPSVPSSSPAPSLPSLPAARN